MAEADEILHSSVLPEVKIDKQELYHGSTTLGISKFNTADETTVGKGVYLTSDPEAAVGYARRRSDNRGGLHFIK